MDHHPVRTSTGAVALVLTCSRCGRPITLTVGPIGAVLADRDLFVLTHRACIDALELPEG